MDLIERSELAFDSRIAGDFGLGINAFMAADEESHRGSPGQAAKRMIASGASEIHQN
jgi:hypothetical protein